MQQIELNKLIISKLNMREREKEKEKDGEKDIPDVEIESDISTLMQSINSQGILNPLLVKPTSDLSECYEIYAGRRRFLAAKGLGLKTVPCIVTEITDIEARVRSMIENYQRVENKNSEKIKTFSELYNQMEAFDPTGINRVRSGDGKLALLCQCVGSKPLTVKRYLALSVLPDRIIKLLDDRNSGLTLKTAESLLKVEPVYRSPLVEMATASKLSSVEFQTLIENFIKNPDPKQLSNMINKTIDEVSQARRQRNSTKQEQERAKEREVNEQVDSPDSNRKSETLSETGGDRATGSGKGEGLDDAVDVYKRQIQ